MKEVSVPKTTQELEHYYDSQQVSQPTAMVHMDRTSLSTTARELVPLMIYVVQNTKKDEDGFYTISKSFIRSATGQGTSHSYYKKIEKAFQEIRFSEIQWNILEADNTVTEYSINFITGRKNNPKRGTLGFEIHERIEKGIRNPKIFAKTKLVFMLLLANKKGGFDFYSLLDDELSRKRVDTSEVIVSINEFKKLQGIEESMYLTFKGFKTRVLKPLCDEVSKNTDIHVTYQGERESGRKFTHIRFFIERQPWQLPLFDIHRFFSFVEEIEETKEKLIEKTIDNVIIHTASENEVIEKFVEQGVTKSDIETALEKWGEESIRDIFDYCLDQQNRGKVQNVAGYMASCLKKGHGMKSKAEKEAEEKKANRKKKADRDKKTKEEEERRKKAQGAYAKKEVQRYISVLSDEERKTLLEELKAESPPIMRRHIKDLNHPSLTLLIVHRIPGYNARLEEYLQDIK